MQIVEGMKSPAPSRQTELLVSWSCSRWSLPEIIGPGERRLLPRRFKSAGTGGAGRRSMVSRGRSLTSRSPLRLVRSRRHRLPAFLGAISWVWWGVGKDWRTRTLVDSAQRWGGDCNARSGPCQRCAVAESIRRVGTNVYCGRSIR